MHAHQRSRLLNLFFKKSRVHVLIVDDVLIAEKIARGQNGVNGIAPFGKFSANNFNTDVEQEIIILDGNVKINFDPNKPLNIFNLGAATNVEGNTN